MAVVSISQHLGWRYRLAAGLELLLQQLNLGLVPAKDGSVIDRHAAVQRHESEIEVTDGKHLIPSDRRRDHLSGELPAFEGLILPHLSRLSPPPTACVH